MSGRTVDFMKKFHEIASLMDLSLLRSRMELFNVMHYLKRTIKVQVATQP